MAKAELTAEQKSAARTAEQERRTNAVLRQIVNLSKRTPEQRQDGFDSMTHAIPKKLLAELVEAKTIKADYLEWIEENAAHIIKKAGSGGGGGTRTAVVREYPTWIDKVGNPPAKLITMGKEFHSNLQLFISDNQKCLDYFKEEYGEVWKDYFRLLACE